MSKVLFLTRIGISCILLFACIETESPVDNVFVDIHIDLSDPQYFDLTGVNNPVYITGGIKGLIVMKTADSKYIALERNCPYQAEKKIAVTLETDKSYAKCSSCGSRYLVQSGSVLTGPSQFALKTYRTSINGNLLHITN